MKKTARRICETLLVSVLVFPALALPAIRAGELPDGVMINCEKGEFGENKYAILRAAIVGPWVISRQAEEQDVAGIALEIAKPAGGDSPEKISIAFTIMDSKREKQYSPLLGGAVRDSGVVMFKWNLLDPDGNRVEDGIYSVVMNITGEHHGDLLRNAVFPLYVVSGPPSVDNPTISTREAVVEFNGAPGFEFTSSGVGICSIVDQNENGDEVSRWEGVMGPGRHTLKSDLLDKDKKPFAPGKYTTLVTMENALGKSRTLEYEYTLAAPPALEVALEHNGDARVEAAGETVIPFTVTLNQSAYLTAEHVSDGGATDYVGESTAERPAVLYRKGTHTILWHRAGMDEMPGHASGAHWLRVTAATLSGERKTVESPKVAIAPIPNPVPIPETQSFPEVKKQEQKRSAPNLSLKLEPGNVLVGDRLPVTIRYRLDQDSIIKLTIFDKNGKVVKRLVDSKNDHIAKGGYRVALDAENLDDGNYKVVFEATNSYGTGTVSEVLSVAWK